MEGGYANITLDRPGIHSVTDLLATSTFSTPRLVSASRAGLGKEVTDLGHLRNVTDGLRTMTYLLAGDIHPGGNGSGTGGGFSGVIDEDFYVLACDSNRTAQWLMTLPVCSTKFSSFLIFLFVTIVLSVITLWTVLGNILVLCALYRYRTLRTMSNVLIGNLAVSDLLLAITVLPVSTTYDLLGFWVFGRSMCTVWLCIDVLYCTASIWGLCTIAFDRYTATVYPMWYHDKRSTRKALTYVGFVWVFSIVISLAPFIGWQEMIPEFYRYDPEINRYRCVLFSTQSYVIYSAMGSFILPSCLMTFLYVQIFAVLHKQSDTLKKKSSVTGSPPGLGHVNGCPQIAVSEMTTSCVMRDITASTFVPDEDRDREEGDKDDDDEDDDEERPDGETEDGEQDDSGVDRTSNTSDGSNKRHGETETETETSLSLLRDQRSNSLNVDMETFRAGRRFQAEPTKDFLAVSTCDIPWQFKLKKSRSACSNLQENGTARGTHVTRSKSATFLCAPLRRETCTRSGSFGHSNSHSNRNSMSLHRLSLPWHTKRSNQMTTSMRRRFQLREQRATKRMLLIMACFFVCWVPFTLMYMLRSLCEHCHVLDEHTSAFIIWLGYANSSLNPLLYTLFNDDFRKAFSKLLRIKRTRRPTRLR